MLENPTLSHVLESSLERKVFDDPASKAVLTKWLEINGYITPVFESRGTFGARK
jgi:hypothetical protein